MTDAPPAGWYADPDDVASLRWWDGARWTEYRSPAAPAEAAQVDDGVVARVRTKDDERHELVARWDSLTFRGDTFALAELDGVQWAAIRSFQNGAYMGTWFHIKVRAGDRKGDYAMDSGSKDKRLDEFADAYGRVVSLLDSAVCPRLARDMAMLLRAGETVTLGPAGARVELTAEGFRLKKPFAKVVPWADVAGTEMEGGRVYFLVRKSGREQPKRHSMVGLEGENVVVLPHLAALLTGATSP